MDEGGRGGGAGRSRDMPGTGFRTRVGAGVWAGILYYEGGPTVIAVFTNQNTGDFVELESTLGRIAEDIVNNWR